METIDDLLDDDLAGLACLDDEECIGELVKSSPENCLYCRLSELGDEED